MRKYTSRYLLSFELTRICIHLHARILDPKRPKLLDRKASFDISVANQHIKNVTNIDSL